MTSVSGRPVSLQPKASSLLRELPSKRLSAAAVMLAVTTFLLIGRIQEFVSERLHLVLLSSGIALGLAVLLPRLVGQEMFRRREVQAVLALLILMVATIPFSVWPGKSFSFVFGSHLKTVIFFLLLVYCIRTYQDLDLVLWGIIGAMLSLEIVSFRIDMSSTRVVTGSYDRNDLAFVTVCLLPLATVLFAERRGAMRYLYGTIAGMAVLTIILSKSRGGFVSLLVVGLLLFRRIPSRPLMRMAMCVVGLSLFALAGSDAYWDRMATIWGERGASVNEYDAGGFWYARWQVWKTGLRFIVENPLLGVGAGVFEIAEGISHGGSGKWDTAHNSFIEIGAELGVGGLLLFLVILCKAVKNCRDVSRLSRHDEQLAQYYWLAQGVETSLYAYIVSGFALSQGYSNVLYCLLGLSLVLRRLVTEPQRSTRALQDSGLDGSNSIMSA